MVCKTFHKSLLKIPLSAIIWLIGVYGISTLMNDLMPNPYMCVCV